MLVGRCTSIDSGENDFLCPLRMPAILESENPEKGRKQGKSEAGNQV
jgi:hypothetical protein